MINSSSQPLTVAFPGAYPCFVTGVPVAGIGVPEKRRTTASERFFCVRHTSHPFYGWLVWGAERLAGSFSRYANLHESAHPIGVGEAETLNRLKRSFAMKRTSKGTSVPVASPTLKLVPVTPLRKPDLPVATVRQDCVDHLRAMLKKAERGELVGLVFISMCGSNTPGYVFDIDMDCVGAAQDNKIFTLGMVAALNHQLAEEI